MTLAKGVLILISSWLIIMVLLISSNSSDPPSKPLPPSEQNYNPTQLHGPFPYTGSRARPCGLGPVMDTCSK